MPVTLIDALKRLSLPIGKYMPGGVSFRIGHGEYELLAGDEQSWTYVDRTNLFQVEVTLEVVRNVAILRHWVTNLSGIQSMPLDCIEPLHFLFCTAPEQWQFIYANGGTTENYYPPLAFRTQECTRLQPSIYPGMPFLIESHPLGRSSNQHLPLLIALLDGADDGAGLFCGMEWSGAWYMTAGSPSTDITSLAVGIKVNGMRLEAQERLELPAVHLGFFSGGPAEATNALRRHLYESVCPPYQGKRVIPRVSYDHWFGIENRFSEELLRRQAQSAAALGIETFVVDAAWFCGDFPNGVGNWDRVDLAKFPQGLRPFADYVRSLGMEFGLWFEPERATIGTSAVEQHPEWFVPVPGSSQSQFYHIDLTQRAAQDYLIETIGNWIEQLDIRWSRWDYNIEPAPYWQAVDPTMKIQFAYFQGLYRVLDTLMREHPDWMVEGCASGGRRIDLGTMRRAHTYWMSDHSNDPYLCRYMQARANRFLPGHLLNSSVAVPLHVGLPEIGASDVLSRMLGKLAFDGDIASLPIGRIPELALFVQEFKNHRHLMVQDFYQLLPTPSTSEDWDAVQFIDYAGTEAVVFVFAGTSRSAPTLRLRGLLPDSDYLMTTRPYGTPMRIAGRDLLAHGLEATLDPHTAALWHLSAVA